MQWSRTVKTVLYSMWHESQFYNPFYIVLDIGSSWTQLSRVSWMLLLMSPIDGDDVVADDTMITCKSHKNCKSSVTAGWVQETRTFHKETSLKLNKPHCTCDLFRCQAARYAMLLRRRCRLRPRWLLRCLSSTLPRYRRCLLRAPLHLLVLPLRMPEWVIIHSHVVHVPRRASLGVL